jgi:hypothetical protein
MTYGDYSGNRIFVLYWRCSLIRVSVIRGSTVISFTQRQSAGTGWQDESSCRQMYTLRAHKYILNWNIDTIFVSLLTLHSNLLSVAYIRSYSLPCFVSPEQYDIQPDFSLCDKHVQISYHKLLYL